MFNPNFNNDVYWARLTNGSISHSLIQ